MNTRLRSIYVLLLILLTGLAYCRLTGNEFIRSFDDGMYVTNNPHVRAGLTIQGIAWAFTTTRSSNWHPLTWMSHMLDWQFYGANAAGHHLTSLLFHIASSILLFLLLCWMTGRPKRSFFVAALFAIHPLHVGSVAWVAERKDVLSTFFCMLTIAGYLHYLRRPSAGRYALIVLAFILGLLSKPMLVSLPLMLLMLDYWPLRRMSISASKAEEVVSARPDGILTLSKCAGWGRLILEKTPLFALAAASCVVTFWAQSAGGSVGMLKDVGVGVRLANAAVVDVIYVLKMLWPQNLSVFYPHPQNTLPMWQVLGSVLLLITASLAAVRSVRSRPYLTMGLLWYLVTLLPVIGLVQVGVQGMADRYTYVPLIGLFIAIAWIVPDLLSRIADVRHRQLVMSVAACLVLISLAARTFAEVSYWKNGASLFRRAAEATDRNVHALVNLGHELAWRDDWAGAAREYEEALRLQPNERDAGVGLGTALVRLGRFPEAEKRLRPMLRVGFRMQDVYEGLAESISGQGRVAESIPYYLKAIREDAKAEQPHLGLGYAYASLNSLDDAAREFSEAARLEPKDAAVHHNLGLVYQRQRRFNLALKEYRTAVELKPDDPQHHQTLAIILYTLGDYPGSWAELQRVERVGGRPDPDLVKALLKIQGRP